MADVNITINAEGAKAISSLVKMANAQGKVETATKKSGRAAGKQARQTLDATAAMRKFISVAGGIFGVTASFALLGTAVRTVDTNLKAVGKKQLDLAQSFVSLAIINPGKVQAAFAAARGLAVDVGIDPGVAARTLQTIQSVTPGGDLVAATASARQALLLQQLEAEEDAAKNIVVFGGEKGRTAQESGKAFQIAAERSARSLSEVAKGAEALPSFEDLNFAAAAISTLTKQFTAEQLATAGRSLGKVLNVPNALTKKAGFEGEDLTELQKLERIAGTLDDFSLAGLKRAGLTEDRQIRALSAALNNIEGIRETMAAIKAAPDTLLADRLEAIQRESPLVRTKFLKERALAAVRVSQLVGPGAQLAQAQTLRRSEIGIRELAAGRGALTVDPETGEANLFRRFIGFMGKQLAVAGIDRSIAPAGGVLVQQRTAGVRPDLIAAEISPQIAAENLEKALEETRDVLTGNTDAIKALTETMSGGVATSPFLGGNGDVE